MPTTRLSPFFTGILALAILAGAGTVRVWYLQTWNELTPTTAHWHVQTPAGTVNAAGKNDHDVLLENLKAQGVINGFRSVGPFAKEEEETAHLAPGYPLFRWAIEGEVASRVGFAEKAYELTRWCQAGLSSLTAMLVFLIATRVFQSRIVGLLAGLGAIAHPFWIINVAELQDGTLSTFLVTFALYLAIRVGQQGGALSALLLGLVLGASALTRAGLLPFAVVVLLWYFWRSRVQANGWLFALVAFLGFACVMASWSVRCQQKLGQPAPVVSTAWWYLWVGNNPAATGGPVTADMEATVPTELREALAKAPQATRYDELRNIVLEQIKDHPAQTLARRAKAMLYFFLGSTDPKRSNLVDTGDAAKPEQWMYNLLGGMLFGIFLLAALGWRWSYGWKSSAPLALAMIFIPLPYILSHAEPLHGPRLPLDGVLICLAAMALGCFIPGVSGHLFRGEAALREGQ